MGNNIAKIDEIGLWSRDKLTMLKKYLDAYVSILSSEKGKKFCKEFHYIDAFAGATEHIDRETGEYVDGSPRVALKTKPHFTSYTFIEQNKVRINNFLTPLKSDFPDRDIKILPGDCNEVLLQKILPAFPRRKRDCPSKLGFIFLDPYGINLKWSTVKAIGEASVFDVLINLSVMGITRQASDKPPPQIIIDRISQLMGGSEWFDICYKQNNQLSLPGMTSPSYVRAHGGVVDSLADCYVKKLKEHFRYVTKFKIMRNSRNSPVYALIFASQAGLAVKTMQTIFNKQ